VMSPAASSAVINLSRYLSCHFMMSCFFVNQVVQIWKPSFSPIEGEGLF
jgi:hypothetical protein